MAQRRPEWRRSPIPATRAAVPRVARVRALDLLGGSDSTREATAGGHRGIGQTEGPGCKPDRRPGRSGYRPGWTGPGLSLAAAVDVHDDHRGLLDPLARVGRRRAHRTTRCRRAHRTGRRRRPREPGSPRRAWPSRQSRSTPPHQRRAPRDAGLLGGRGLRRRIRLRRLLGGDLRRRLRERDRHGAGRVPVVVGGHDGGRTGGSEAGGHGHGHEQEVTALHRPQAIAPGSQPRPSLRACRRCPPPRSTTPSASTCTATTTKARRSCASRPRRRRWPTRPPRSCTAERSPPAWTRPAGTPSCARDRAPTSRSICAPTSCGWPGPGVYRVTGRALRAGRTLAVADVSVEAWDEPGRPVAVGRVQYLRTGD